MMNEASICGLEALTDENKYSILFHVSILLTALNNIWEVSEIVWVRISFHTCGKQVVSMTAHLELLNSSEYSAILFQNESL